MTTNILTYEDSVSCLSSSPNDFLVGLYTGHIIIDDTNRKNIIRAHKNPCRVVTYHDGRSKIITGSSKGYLGIVDTESFKLERKIKACRSAISAISSLDVHKIISADDTGNIFIHDLRTKADEPAIKFLDIHDDYIIKMLNVHSQNAIISISGNGTIGKIDTRKWSKTPLTMSIDEEILSCCLVSSSTGRHSERILLATDSGVLGWFDWDSHETFSRKVKGDHIQANAMISIDSETFLLGCDDGNIYSLNVNSNFKNDSTPICSIDGSVENIVFLSDRRVIGVSTMDKSIHVFPHIVESTNLEPPQPRNFFDDLME